MIYNTIHSLGEETADCMIVKLRVGISLNIMTVGGTIKQFYWSILCQSLNKTHPSINRVNYHYHDNGVVMLLDAVSLLLTPLLHGGELVLIGAFLSTRGKGGREGGRKRGREEGWEERREGERERGREGGREEGREGGRERKREGGRERERESEQ